MFYAEQTSGICIDCPAIDRVLLKEACVFLIAKTNIVYRPENCNGPEITEVGQSIVDAGELISVYSVYEKKCGKINS